MSETFTQTMEPPAAGQALYLKLVWVPRQNGAITVADAANALWIADRIYEFAVLLEHPDYQQHPFPPHFMEHTGSAIKADHRLQFVSLERRNPLWFLALIPPAVAGAKVVVAGAGTAWALVQTFDKVANFKLNRRKLKADVDIAEADAERVRFENELARRGANTKVVTEQLQNRTKEAGLRLVDGELSDEKPAA